MKTPGKNSTDEAIELLCDQLYETTMANITIELHDQYYNWYHGYTQIRLPYFDNEYGFYDRIDTAATYGTISTKDFGKRFRADKVTPMWCAAVQFFLPESLHENRNVTLQIEFETVQLNDLTTGFEKIEADYEDIIEEYAKQNHTPPLPSACCTDRHFFRLIRNVKIEDIKNQKLEVMPGFRIKWYYSGMKVEPVAKYANEDITKAFVREGSNDVISDLDCKSVFIMY